MSLFHFVLMQKFILTVSPEQNPNFFPTKSRCGMNRSATASLHSATPKKNVPCFLDLAVVKFFLKKERTFFFGVLPSRSRAGGGTMRTKFWQNFGSSVFEFRCRKWKRRGLGRNFPFAPLFVLGEFGADIPVTVYHIIVIYYTHAIYCG